MEDAAGQLLGAAVDRHCPTLGNVISILTYVAFFIAFILGNACFISSTICVVKGEIGGYSAFSLCFRYNVIIGALNVFISKMEV